MATSSIAMLSNVSMERLYLFQPPAWNELQRLSFPLNQQSQSQQGAGRASQQIIRNCYDKLLHHIYDMSSTVSTATDKLLNQINEQLELTAEYCQLKTFKDNNSIYLHSDRFFLQVSFDPIMKLPINVEFHVTNDVDKHEETLQCYKMLQALNDKQYRLFRMHLNGFVSLFSLSAPTMNDDKRIGYTAYKILQQDLERLAKTNEYGRLFKGLELMCEGLPMRIQLNDQVDTNLSLPSHVRVVLVQSSTQHLLPVKSAVEIDETSNRVHLETSDPKQCILATGHFALEIDEVQPPLTLIETYIQEIVDLTSMNHFVSNLKKFNYLSSVMPKTKFISRYKWYISQDQTAVAIRQIPFTNVKQLVTILNLLEKQIYLTKYVKHYFHLETETEPMEEDVTQIRHEICLELSLLSPTMISITSAQSSNLTTFLLHFSNTESLPFISHRQQQHEVPLIQENNSLLKLIEQLLQGENFDASSSPIISMMDSSSNAQSELKPMPHQRSIPKLNRRLSCVPPAKPVWRPATTLRRMQGACLTIMAREESDERSKLVKIIDEDRTQPMYNEELANADDDQDDDDLFFSDAQQQGNNLNQQLQSKMPSGIHPLTLSRCTSVSSTQSVSTPPIFGLTPSTPYPNGTNGQSNNIFFPLAKQVSNPDFNPPSPSITIGPFNPSAFLSANTPTLQNSSPSGDTNNQTQMKTKRPRPDNQSEEFNQSTNPNSDDNRPALQGGKTQTGTGDASAHKRIKKGSEKPSQSGVGSSLARQKSGFKVSDSPSHSLVSQTSLTSSDETGGDNRPLKVVIKRLGEPANSSNDETQQLTKQRKKSVPQQSQGNLPGTGISGSRKLASNPSPIASSPSVLVKSESFDGSQINVDLNAGSFMPSNDGNQQIQRERPRPPSSLSNPVSASPSISSQSRPAAPQPPIVLKINKSKVYSGQEQNGSNSTPTTAVATISTPTSGPPPSKDSNKIRSRSNTTGITPSSKSTVTSPPNPATKLTNPSTSIGSNPLGTSSTLTSLFRIPKKTSSQDVTSKVKTETDQNPTVQKPPLLPTPNNPTDLSKTVNRMTSPTNIRPTQSSSQVGSWQSPPTQQPSRFPTNRPRPSWPQSNQQQMRGRAPATPPNVPGMPMGHPPFNQQPRSILKKPSSNDFPGAESFYMGSELNSFNDQRSGNNFPPSSSSTMSRTSTPPVTYDDNDDDTSPQAQLVIDTSTSSGNNVLLPYTIVPGSNSASAIDSFDSSHDSHSMNPTSQHYQHHQQQQSNPYRDEASSNQD